MADGPAPDSSRSPEAQARAILIRNERLKITANYANGLAIAVAAIGGITPFFSLGVGAPPDPAHRAATLLGCVLVSGGLHVLAHQLLRMLR